ncbi:transcription factor CRZ1 [Microdochium nivale]|nr:transcription factor CRZ1 [Microdochium nivale]
MPAKRPATFQCSLCPCNFTRVFNLHSHLRTHTKERPFTCSTSTCKRTFTRQSDCREHENQVHSTNKPFVCGGSTWGCGKAYKRRTNLVRHHRSQRGISCTTSLLKQNAESHHPDKTSGVMHFIVQEPAAVSSSVASSAPQDISTPVQDASTAAPLAGHCFSPKIGKTMLECFLHVENELQAAMQPGRELGDMPYITQPRQALSERQTQLLLLMDKIKAVVNNIEKQFRDNSHIPGIEEALPHCHEKIADLQHLIKYYEIFHLDPIMLHTLLFDDNLETG